MMAICACMEGQSLRYPYRYRKHVPFIINLHRRVTEGLEFQVIDKDKQKSDKSNIGHDQEYHSRSMKKITFHDGSFFRTAFTGVNPRCNPEYRCLCLSHCLRGESAFDSCLATLKLQENVTLLTKSSI